jgi:hypothetical protein
LICKIIPVSKNWNMIPGMVVHIFNPSTPEAEARDLGASLGYIAKPVSKKKKGVRGGKHSTCACNPSYLGSRDWKNHGSKSVQVKVSETPSNSTNKLGVAVSTCHPSYAGGINRSMIQIRVQKCNPLPEKKYLKHKGLGAWLKGQSTSLTSAVP